MTQGDPIITLNSFLTVVKMSIRPAFFISKTVVFGSNDGARKVFYLLYSAYKVRAVFGTIRK
jgi:hypothetical protein